jgi:hypothetical protein
MKIRTIAGPWFSLGVHVDFKHRRIEIHFIWWIFVIGNTADDEYCGRCEVELKNGVCPSCKTDYGYLIELRNNANLGR